VTTTTASTQTQDTVELLHQLNRDYIKSVQTSDVRWFEANLANDFLNINADGSLVDRAGFLTQIAKPINLSSLAATEVRLRIIGDVAVINARTVYTKPDGQSGSRRYTDVWSRQQGRWLCISAQLTTC
jgi:ketosteroid isomerase-like protein